MSRMRTTIPEADLRAMMAPTAADIRLAKRNPKAAAQRLKERREFAYEAAVNTRLRVSATRLQGPEDYSAFPERLQIIRQVRDLDQNFGLFQSIIDKLAIYCFGRLRYEPRTGDTRVDSMYKEYLAEKFQGLDVTGRFNLRLLTCVAFKSMLRDGDFGWKWQKGADGMLRLVGIEGDRLGGIYMTSADENYFQGVITDPDTGIPQLYRVYNRTKANAYVNPQDVPARQFLHILDPRRINQYRGVTPFAPVINEARDLKELMEALRIGTKFENYHAAVVYTPSGLPLNDPNSFLSDGETNSVGTPLTEQEIKFGLFQHAPNDAKVDFLKSERPAGTVQSYMEALIRTMGMALNLPYGFLYNLSALGGPSARMDSQQAHRVIQWHQENMQERALEPVKNTSLIEGFSTGRIPYVANWKRGAWMYPPAISIDLGRDSAAAINEWRAGLLSKQEWFSEIGEDAEDMEAVIRAETERTLKAAQEIATQFKVPVELALTMLELRTPNGFYNVRNTIDDESTGPNQAAKPSAEPSAPAKPFELPPINISLSQPAPAENIIAPSRPPRADAATIVRKHIGIVRTFKDARASLADRRNRLTQTADPLKWLKQSTGIEN